jgi:hypothetical protein
MSKLFKIIHNGQTNEIEKILLTDVEVEALQEEESKAAAKVKIENIANAARLTKRNELLIKLGITEEEAKLLLLAQSIKIVQTTTERYVVTNGYNI